MSDDIIHIDRLMLVILAAKTGRAYSASYLATIEDCEGMDSAEGLNILARTFGSETYGEHDFDHLAATAIADTVKVAGLKTYYRPDEPRPEVTLVMQDEVLNALWSGDRPRNPVKLPNGQYDSRNKAVSEALHMLSTHYQTLRIVPLSVLVTLTGPWAMGRKWDETLKAIKATVDALEGSLSKVDLQHVTTMADDLPLGPYCDLPGLPSRDAFDFGSIFKAGMAWDNCMVGGEEDAA